MIINRIFENKLFFIAVVLAFALAVGLSAAFGSGPMMNSSALLSSSPTQVASNQPGGGPDPWSTLASNQPGGGPDPWSTLASNQPGGGPDPWSTLA
jgi:hypothetical protein